MTKESKNDNFVQLYREHINDIANLALSNKPAYRLFMLLIEHMDGTNALAVSNAALQELLGYSKVTVCKAIKFLKDNGWVCILKNGTSNVYVVNPEVAWTSYDNQKKYCKFNANVLLSSTENAEYLNNPNASTHFKTIDAEFMKTAQRKRKQFLEEANRIAQ